MGLKQLSLSSIFIIFCCSAGIAQDIVIQGLFKDKAFIKLDGETHWLKKGVPVGNVELMSSNTKEAVIEVNGEAKTYTVTRKISSGFTKKDKREFRISASKGNHHFTRAQINGVSMNVLVDTGATKIALSGVHASRLGITEKDSLGWVSINTANGLTRGYIVNLRSVTVGSITINNVQAVVTPGDSPGVILLGNTFLSKLDMRIENGVLILQTKY